MSGVRVFRCTDPLTVGEHRRSESCGDENEENPQLRHEVGASPDLGHVSGRRDPSHTEPAPTLGRRLRRVDEWITIEALQVDLPSWSLRRNYYPDFRGFDDFRRVPCGFWGSMCFFLQGSFQDVLCIPAPANSWILSEDLH